MNMFLVNLSIADFLTSAFGSPFPLIASITHRWPFGETMCTVYAFGMSVGGNLKIIDAFPFFKARSITVQRIFHIKQNISYRPYAIMQNNFSVQKTNQVVFEVKNWPLDCTTHYNNFTGGGKTM